MTAVLHDHVLKYIVIGDVGVGKSCFLFQFTDQLFMQESSQTVCVEFNTKIVQVNDKRFKLQIWDTSGQDKFREIAKTHYRGSSCIFLLYDTTSRSTFDHIVGWLNEAKGTTTPGTVLVLIGNKCEPDANIEVTTEEGQEFAQKEGLLFYEVSAKTGLNVQNAFMDATKKVYERIQEGEISSPSFKALSTLSTDSLLDNPNNRISLGAHQMDSLERLYSKIATYSELCASAGQQSRMTVRLCVLPWQIIGRALVFCFYMFLQLAFILPTLFLVSVQRPRRVPLKPADLNDSQEIIPVGETESISAPLFIVKSFISLIFLLAFPLVIVYYLIPIYIFKDFQVYLVGGILGLQAFVLIMLAIFGIVRRLQKRKNPLIVSRSDELKLETHANKIRWNNIGNWLVMLFLVIEWFQVVGDPIRHIGGASFFNAFYLSFSSHPGIMNWFWISITGIFVLFGIVNIQIMNELRQYLNLKRQGKLEEAHASFYFSLIGSIVFGHGKPDNITRSTRYAAIILCDGLFLLIIAKLYSIFPCEYKTISGDSVAYLVDDLSVKCWDYSHYLASFFSVFFIGYYTLFSFLISPVIVESSGISVDIHFHGIYTTAVNLVKLILLFHHIIVLQPLFTTKGGSLLSSLPAIAQSGLVTFILFLVLACAIIAWTQITSTRMRQPSACAHANIIRAWTFACAACVGFVAYISLRNASNAQEVSHASQSGATAAVIISLTVIAVIWFLVYRRKQGNYGEFSKMTNSEILVDNDGSSELDKIRL